MRVAFCSTLVLLLLSGCASTSAIDQPYSYDPDQSRALNLAHSVGLDELDDTVVSKNQLSDGIGGAVTLGLDTASFMSPSGLNLNFGPALGAGLLMSMAEPKAQIKRDSIIAWVPEAKVPDTGQGTAEGRVLRWLSDSLASATIDAMDELNIEHEVKNQHRDFGLPFMFSDYLTEIKGLTASGIECKGYFRVKEGSVSERMPLPAFLPVSGYGYKVYAGDDRRYPAGFAACFGKGVSELNQKFQALVSEKLPPTVFMYKPPANLGERGVRPPYILDQGKQLLFVKIKEDEQSGDY
ncbi:hypothetical protein [Marinobacter sp.]|uniref:hypothetical protein n=1 Tax=Marinobacter sp. TaxID=50741 RepID=UPI003A8E242F